MHMQIKKYMPGLSQDTQQLVMNVLNDQLKTTLMLQYPAKILGAAALKFILSFMKNRPVCFHLSLPRWLPLVLT